jgi:hypothetical protein
MRPETRRHLQDGHGGEVWRGEAPPRPLLIGVGLLMLLAFAVFIPRALVVGGSAALIPLIYGALLVSGRWPPQR